MRGSNGDKKSKGETTMRKSLSTFYRDSLSDTAQFYYETINKLAIEREDKFKINFTDPELDKNVTASIEALRNDHPEFYFLNGFSVEGDEIQLTYKMLTTTADLDKVMDRITFEARRGSSRFFQAAAVYDYIVTHISERPRYESPLLHDSTIINPALFHIGNNEGCCRLMVYAMRYLGNNAAVMCQGDAFYCLLNLDNVLFKVDFLKNKKNALEQYPESEKSSEWLLELPVEAAARELNYMSSPLFQQVVRDLVETEDGRQLLCTYFMKYEFTFENLSWDFLRAIAKTGYDTNTEQMLEQMANVHFIKALNVQNGSAYYLEENRNQYMQIMTQLHPETPEEILWAQIGKKYPDIANKYKKCFNEWIYRCDMTEIIPFWKA